MIMQVNFKRFISLALLLLMIISLYACGKQNTERTTDVVVSLGSDGVYGIVIEYSVDRTRLGGQIASCDPEMTKPLPKEEHTIKFAEQGFGESYTLDSGKFGILVVVVLENGEEIPLQYLWEWNAAYGEQYHFTLSGDKESGFVLTPSDDVDCTITPWDELPSEFLN